MGSPINPKYPLFLRDFGKNKANNKENNIVGGGYPVITVEDNFNIEAKPNTFYNIKNDTDSEVSINFNVNELYATGKNKHIMFTFDGWDNPDNILNILLCFAGGVINPDNTKEGYKYNMIVDLNMLEPGMGTTKVYFTDNITEGNNVHAYVNIFGNEMEEDLNNIHIINNNIDYLYYITITEDSDTITFPSVILEEVNNDNDNFKHKYAIFSQLRINNINHIYTKESCDTATSDFIFNGTQYVEAQLVKKINRDVKGGSIANEFVFNINSPANITFSDIIKWNNDSIPDLTKTGIYTISILDGVGCYTFVNY